MLLRDVPYMDWEHWLMRQQKIAHAAQNGGKLDVTAPCRVVFGCIWHFSSGKN